MRSYAKSIELYERTRKTLAGGVSSNVRYAARRCRCSSNAARARGSTTSMATCISTTCWATARPSWAMRPSRSIEAVARHARAEGQVYAAPASARDRAGRAALPLLPGTEVVRFATSGTEAVLMAMRLARAFTGRDQDPEVRGPLSRLERPGLYQRPPAAERGRPGRRAGAGRRLARHAAERAATTWWSPAGTISSCWRRPSNAIRARSPASSWSR